MKKHIIALTLVFGIVTRFTALGQDTFSIVAVDSSTGIVGSAGASCIDGSIIISDVHPGVGVIHTQSYWHSANQNYARTLMNQRHSPQQIIDSLVAHDAEGNPTIRQYGIVDLVGGGRRAAYTGVNCYDYKNHILGPTYAIQGNILLGQQILDSMEARFLNTTGTFIDRLMAALQGAKVPGADTRCSGRSSISAFIRVALPRDTVGLPYYLDLAVDNAPYPGDPIDSLQVLFDRWKQATVTPASAGVLYGASTDLYTVSTENGAATSIGQIGPGQIQGLAVRPTTRELYGVLSNGLATLLYRISSATGNGVVDRYIPVANMQAIAFSPGDTLYGATTSGNLYRIDLARDTAIAIGPSSGRAYSSLSFSPRTGRLWALVCQPPFCDSLFTIDHQTGIATFMQRAGQIYPVTSIAFSPGDTLYGLLGDTGQYLIRIDSTGSEIIGETLAGRVNAIAMYGLLTSVDEQKVPLIPQTFAVHQNYPNPFNPSTTIRYDLPRTSHVSLSVFDVLGREVATLLNEEKSAGTYTVQWDASGVGSGVYFYRVKAGDFVQTKRMILLR